MLRPQTVDDSLLLLDVCDLEPALPADIPDWEDEEEDTEERQALAALDFRNDSYTDWSAYEDMSGGDYE